MPVKELDQQYIYWRYKSKWCIAKLQVSPSCDRVFLYIWHLDGTYVGMTAGKQPESILQSKGYKLWLQEGRPDLKHQLEEQVRNKAKQIELF